MPKPSAHTCCTEYCISSFCTTTVPGVWGHDFRDVILQWVCWMGLIEYITPKRQRLVIQNGVNERIPKKLFQEPCHASIFLSSS